MTRALTHWQVFTPLCAVFARVTIKNFVGQRDRGTCTFCFVSRSAPKPLETGTRTKLRNMKTASITHKDLNHAEIAAKAYQIWEESGRPPGSELENWLKAEKELAAASASNGRADAERTVSTTATALPMQPAGKTQPSQRIQRQQPTAARA